MANEEQLAILQQGVDVWNEWRKENEKVRIDLNDFSFRPGIDLTGVNFFRAELSKSALVGANLSRANLMDARLVGVDFTLAHLNKGTLRGAVLLDAKFSQAGLKDVNFAQSAIGNTIFADLDLSEALGLDEVFHKAPSLIGRGSLLVSEGKIPEKFLRGCGLSDWEIEEVKLYNPHLSNEDVNKILYQIYELRASQAIQISPLFISYSHADAAFVDKLERHLIKKGIRFWRDVHDATAGPLEEQIGQAIRLNPTVLVILSEYSITSDWVEHEVRTARELGKEMKRHVLCPVALDNRWKSSLWPKRLIEQVMEYNILDFSAWEDDSKFDVMFRKLIDGLELFYKG